MMRKSIEYIAGIASAIYDGRMAKSPDSTPNQRKEAMASVIDFVIPMLLAEISEDTYFAADPSFDGFSLHNSLLNAYKEASSALDCERSLAVDDGWREEPPQICYGIVLGRCKEIEGSRRKATLDGEEVDIVDFKLTKPSDFT